MQVRLALGLAIEVRLSGRQDIAFQLVSVRPTELSSHGLPRLNLDGHFGADVRASIQFLTAVAALRKRLLSSQKLV